MSGPRLSLIMIAKNETRDLPGCLASVEGLVDEIVVVVDGDASDLTGRLAGSLGAKVFERRFEGFGAQKQYALEKASGDWALNMDADERVTPALKEEIRSLLRGAPSADGYRLPFEVEFLGKVLRHGGVGAERKLRLFRRGAGRFTSSSVHEEVEVNGAVGTLRGRLRHRPYESLSEYISKFDQYTSIGARKAYAEGRRFRCWHHARLPLEFAKRYVLQLGLLDRGSGFVWCVMAALYSWVKMLKLKELEGSLA